MKKHESPKASTQTQLDLDSVKQAHALLKLDLDRTKRILCEVEQSHSQELRSQEVGS